MIIIANLLLLQKLKAEIKLVEGLLAEYDNHGNHGPVGTAV